MTQRGGQSPGRTPVSTGPKHTAEQVWEVNNCKLNEVPPNALAVWLVHRPDLAWHDGQGQDTACPSKNTRSGTVGRKLSPPWKGSRPALPLPHSMVTCPSSDWEWMSTKMHSCQPSAVPKGTPAATGDIRHMPINPCQHLMLKGTTATPSFLVLHRAEGRCPAEAHCRDMSPSPGCRLSPGRLHCMGPAAPPAPIGVPTCTNQNLPCVPSEPGTVWGDGDAPGCLAESEESAGEAKVIRKPPTLEPSLLARLQQTWLMCFSLSIIWLITGSGPFIFTS